MKIFKFILSILFLAACVCNLYANQGSVYTQKPIDPEAFYFTPENYNIRADGKMDVSDALQAALNQVKTEKSFGILFLPEGKYLISKTIHIPSSIRLIGYGANRPEIILAKNTPGFQTERNYMVWFTGGLVQIGGRPGDAGAGTFYSALSNINFRVEKGNPMAVCIRSRFAQHGFISHCNMYVGDGHAGIYDVGNELENIRVYGGDYGITSGRSSPGWPVALVDAYFEGQRKAAIISREAGLAIVNMYVKNAPVGFEMEQGRVDRLHLENSYFENVKTGFIVNTEDNSFSQLNLMNLHCKNVPVLVHYAQSGKKDEMKEASYLVKDYTYGLVLKDLNAPSELMTIRDIVPLAQFSPPTVNDIPVLPQMETWVNVRDFGAMGDGETDDTEAFRKAIAQHKNIYVPQGWYRITETVKMQPGTKLIGLHPFGTQFIIKESEPAFSGFGAPKPMVESSQGGDDIINGIGISTGGLNYRAVGLKWMAGQKSLMNDIKFVGGHGSMRRPVPVVQDSTQSSSQSIRPQGRQGGVVVDSARARPGGGGGGGRGGGGGGGGLGGTVASRIPSPSNPIAAQGLDLGWDNQHWSLWITNGGGGTIKDVWTANTYAANGVYVSNTKTPGRIYAMSLEHHVRSEARFDNVENWKVYAFQFEEEGREGKDCRIMDVNNCRNILFANLWIYRVIRANTPQEFGIRLWNSENIQFRNFHNYTQVLPVIELPIYDVNKKLPVYAWDFARLNVSGKEASRRPFDPRPGAVNKIGEGFEFASGLTADSKGNVYFGEYRLKKLYKFDASKFTLSLLADFPWKPLSLATDTKDNLLVIVRYDPQPGFSLDSAVKRIDKLPFNNGNYSGWGNNTWAALGYSIDPNNPDETLRPLQRVPTPALNSVQKIIIPAHSWRGNFDQVVMSMPDSCLIAPDKMTIIPEAFDIGRSASFLSYKPGQSEPVFIANENNKTTVRLDVSADGKLTNLKTAFPYGQYSSAVDKNGNLYIADGEIFVYDKSGKLFNRFQIEERPLSIVIGGKDFNILFATTSKSLYSIQLGL